MTSVLKEPVIAVAKNQVYKAALASKSDLRTEGATTAFAHFELKPPLVSLPSSSLPSLPPSLPYLPYGLWLLRLREAITLLTLRSPPPPLCAFEIFTTLSEKGAPGHEANMPVIRKEKPSPTVLDFRENGHYMKHNLLRWYRSY